jgi:hypothetical protein
MNYRIHFWCPRCDKTADVVSPIVPKRLACHWCLRDDNKVQDMRIIDADEFIERFVERYKD